MTTVNQGLDFINRPY